MRPRPFTMIDKQHLIESKHFCILPFISSRIWHTAVVPCCVNHETVFGRTSEKSLEEIYSNDNAILKNFRSQIINGPDLPSSCQRCTDCERSGVPSYRQQSNKKWQHLLNDLEFDEQGHLDEYRITLWDGVGYTNLCNLKCRMCHSYLSSSNREEEVKHGIPMKQVSPMQLKQLENFSDLLPKVLINSFRDINELYNFFYQHLDSTKEIKFEGGEPMMMEEQYKILEFLIAQKKTDVALYYPTNLTRIGLKSYNVIDLWQHFKTVEIGVSLDAVEAQNYYIRHPANWQDIIDNLNVVREKCPHVKITIQTTIQILNSFAATRLHAWAISQSIDMQFIFLKHPTNMSLTSLPVMYKKRVRDHWENYMTECPVHMHAGISGFLSMMDAEDTSMHIQQFLVTMRQRDQIRNEDLFYTFPELKELADI